jgi:hypothetical protein
LLGYAKVDAVYGIVKYGWRLWWASAGCKSRWLTIASQIASPLVVLREKMPIEVDRIT